MMGQPLYINALPVSLRNAQANSPGAMTPQKTFSFNRQTI